MSKALPDVRAVVKALGGARKVSAMFDLTENAVWNWTATDRLPANTYVAIRDALKSKGLRAPDELWRMAGVSRGSASSSRSGAAA